MRSLPTYENKLSRTYPTGKVETQFVVLEFHSESPLDEPREHIRETQAEADSLARELCLVSPIGLAKVEHWEKIHEEIDFAGNRYICPGRQIGETVEYDGLRGVVVVR